MGSLAALVLNLPSRIFALAIPFPLRGVAVLVMVVFYYLFWMLVRVTYRLLTTPKA